MSCFEKIYNATSKIPKGKVTNYGQIAKLIGLKNPRIVGFALHINKNPNKIPCHRVVYSNGKLSKEYAFGGIKVQRKKLEKEGVLFLKNGKIDLEKSIFKF